MEKWILIIADSGFKTGKSLDHIEFASKMACENVMTYLQSLSYSFEFLACVPSGIMQ